MSISEKTVNETLPKKHRVRKNHKPIYATLHFLEFCGNRDPVPSVELAELLEIHMTHQLRRKDYNRTCRTLVEHGMLKRYIDPVSRRVAFTLTEKSREIAPQCFKDYHSMTEPEFIASLSG